MLKTNTPISGGPMPSRHDRRSRARRLLHQIADVMTANEAYRYLQNVGLGYRRKDFLQDYREIRNLPPPSLEKQEKHIPEKYRITTSVIRHTRRLTEDFVVETKHKKTPERFLVYLDQIEKLNRKIPDRYYLIYAKVKYIDKTGMEKWITIPVHMRDEGIRNELTVTLLAEYMQRYEIRVITGLHLIGKRELY